MQESPPPLHSRSRGRTRPARKRATPAGPDLGRLRGQLTRGSLVVAAFIVLAAIGGRALSGPSGTALPRPSATLSTTAPAGATSVEVTRIVDGDTLDVRAAETPLRVRLYGVDTPERGEACFEEATERLATLAGDRVLLLPDARTTDRYDRQLRYVFTEDGRSIDAALVAEGLGRAWREDGSRRDALVALEDHARATGTGCLWSRP